MQGNTPTCTYQYESTPIAPKPYNFTEQQNAPMFLLSTAKHQTKNKRQQRYKNRRENNKVHKRELL